MVTPDRKVRKLMEEYEKTGNLSKAAIRADMDRKTARKYVRSGRLPSQMRAERDWRTRPDPFAAHWEECATMLEELPGLEAKFLFAWLRREHPADYQEGQLRTFQRRVRQWRALEGPEREVFFPQVHEPGVRLSTDFTRTGELGMTVACEPFKPLLCHCVLTYSNWEWATVCSSESLLALRTGVQAALQRLGHVPKEHWTDHSSAATHNPAQDMGEHRCYNRGYLDLMEHYGMQARTIQVKAPHENGDVESLNGALKRLLEQHLLLRGSREFESAAAFERFVQSVLEQSNQGRRERLSEELTRMRVLQVERVVDHIEYRCRVRSWSTINVKRRIYSVPSRLIGQVLSVQRYENHIEVYFDGVHQLSAPWQRGEHDHCINYRHLIGWLVRKPGAFRQYRFRADLFPGGAFAWAYEALSDALSERTADREYLQILHHAALTMECEVDAALRALRQQGATPRLDAVLRECPSRVSSLPEQAPLRVSLQDYDRLLEQAEVRS